ncbi:hypothetical protein EDWATA_03734 [Edwardsiella tarda ATCC 23685]|uniref:Uncharacterized protein n=1 Tax=Edwardsiella tarda ATCC 23685 TaxID=500638 RepID=D4FAB6_EDWTA|nr:hypothetical protein EDWATA_03734 [Edwardsiella tarda ATCC 23685]
MIASPYSDTTSTPVRPVPNKVAQVPSCPRNRYYAPIYFTLRN